MKKQQQIWLLGLLVFLVYTCMYAIRKPYTAYTFTGNNWLGLDIKAWFVIAQITGYAISKWVGISWMGQLIQRNRAVVLIVLFTAATLPLLAMPYLPSAGKVICLMLNGFPLGLVYGIVYSWVEGRRHTEIIGSLLACTFVFSSGLVKSGSLFFGQTLGWSDWQAPGFFALIALVISIPLVALLNRMPGPDSEDIALRSPRVAANHQTRKGIIRRFGIPIFFWVLAYFMLTIIRDLRDNFSAEVLAEAGKHEAGVFLMLETPVSLLLLVVTALLSTARSHQKAIQLISGLSQLGLILTMVSTLLFMNQVIPTSLWLLFVGTGSYLGYILINISLFDRLISASGAAANATFLLYIADAWGYLGSVAITLTRYLLPVGISWSEWLSYLFTGAGVLALIAFATANSFANEELSKPTAVNQGV
jgi:hypothetical protein